MSTCSHISEEHFHRLFTAVPYDRFKRIVTTRDLKACPPITVQTLVMVVQEQGSMKINETKTDILKTGYMNE